MAVKVKASRSFETSRKDTRRHFPEDLNPHAATALKLQFRHSAAHTGGTVPELHSVEAAEWQIADRASAVVRHGVVKYAASKYPKGKIKI